MIVSLVQRVVCELKTGGDVAKFQAGKHVQTGYGTPPSLVFNDSYAGIKLARALK